MTIQKNPDKLSEIDRKLGVIMRECRICGFRFHVLPKRKMNFKNKENELQEDDSLCFLCVMEGK